MHDVTGQVAKELSSAPRRLSRCPTVAYACQGNGIFFDGSAAHGEFFGEVCQFDISNCNKNGILVQGQASVRVITGSVLYCGESGVRTQTLDTHVLIRQGGVIIFPSL